MNVEKQIDQYINSQPEVKRKDMQQLHELILDLMPNCRLWFLDGKNADGKTVSNPNIGYGSQTMQYADGSVREFYRIGLSANSTGVSVYLMGIKDKNFLADTFGKKLGKANITGYCIKFKALKDIRTDILSAAIQHVAHAK